MIHAMTAYYGHEDGVLLGSQDDISGFLDHVLSEAAKDSGNTCASIYINDRPVDEDNLPDHEIRVGVVPTSQSWALGFTDVRGSMYVKGVDSGAAEVPFLYQGHDESFPGDSLLEMKVVLDALSEILTTGERPTTVEWSSTR